VWLIRALKLTVYAQHLSRFVHQTIFYFAYSTKICNILLRNLVHPAVILLLICVFGKVGCALSCESERWWTFRFYKMRGISSVFYYLLASLEGLCSVELVRGNVIIAFFFLLIFTGDRLVIRWNIGKVTDPMFNLASRPTNSICLYFLVFNSAENWRWQKLLIFT
jgi:hypothetical protein